MMHALTASLISLLLMAPLAPGWLGVYLAGDTDQAVVAEVIPGTPADKAGLKGGDVLLAVGDTKTPTREKFIAAIKGRKSGSRVKIKLRRGKRERVIVVKLGERPASQGAGAVEPPPPAKPSRTKPSRPAPAIEVAPSHGHGAATNKGKGFLGLSVREAQGGLTVERILGDGPCAESGLQEGDVITALGDHRIRSLDDLDGALRKVHPGRQVAIAVMRGSSKMLHRVKVGHRPDRRREAVRAPVHQRKPVMAEEVVEAPESPVVVEIVPSKPAKKGRGTRRDVIVRTNPSAVVVETARRAAGRRATPSEPKPARSAEFNLERELKELRSELKELRRLLEQMRRDKRGE